MFTARYGLIPYIKQITFSLLIFKKGRMLVTSIDECVGIRDRSLTNSTN